MKTFSFLFLFLLSLSAHATRIDLFEIPNDDLTDKVQGEIRSCSPQATAQVKTAEKSLLLRLEQLQKDWLVADLVSVKRNFVDAENRMWIPGHAKNLSYQTYWSELGSTLKVMVEKARTGINFECKNSGGNCSPGTIAYVTFLFNKPRPMIYLCPPFFQETGAQDSTLLHELSHYAASTDDLALEWWKKDQSDLKKAAKDAYHIESFMKEEVPNVLRRMIWFWWWPKKAI